MKIKKIFGGDEEIEEQQNVMYAVLKRLGYKVIQEAPITTLTVYIIEELNKLGYYINKTER